MLKAQYKKNMKRLQS